MKRSELADICNKIIEMHISDLKNELPKIADECMNNSDDTVEKISKLIVNLSTNSIAHSVQAITDVLVNVDLLQIEED